MCAVLVDEELFHSSGSSGQHKYINRNRLSPHVFSAAQVCIRSPFKILSLSKSGTTAWDSEAKDEEKEECGIVGAGAVMSHLAVETLGWLNFYAAQAATVHSALQLSVEQLHHVF